MVDAVRYRLWCGSVFDIPSHPQTYRPTNEVEYGNNNFSETVCVTQKQKRRPRLSRIAPLNI